MIHHSEELTIWIST